MYYGAGLLSTYDRWPSLQQGSSSAATAPPPPAPSRKRRGRGGANGGPSGSGTRQRGPRAPGQVKSNNQEQEDWDEISSAIKEEEDSDKGLYAGMNPRAAAR